MTKSLRSFLALLTCVLVLFASACSSGKTEPAAPAPSSAGAWPRTITGAKGETTLEKQPTRIVSTSVVLTGSLLAIDAPVIGTGAAKPNDRGLDNQGLFAHWSPIAKEHGVKVLYNNQEVDLEAVASADPDLILVAATGGDSAMDAYDQLTKLAPVVVIDYNKIGWEEVTKQLGTITGLEENASKVLEDYSTKISELKASMQAPSDPVQMIVHMGEKGAAFAKPGGPHDKVISELGFKLDTTDLTKANKGQGAGQDRGDFVFLSQENAVAALTAKDVLIVGGDDKIVDRLKSDPAYGTIPAARSGKLVPLGVASYKLDYYSALDMAEHLAAAYKK
ncbi:Fe2+-enterobactin ABC transporter substrate-binding protein [Gephyromycinifex aptenodytis]|uniref:Fe2+-enterobactin ABC transporter substrate-binding protein n=1 Tax=Gephyromycinifex aptenodytis TaxID=2716227 RepID=UPI0014482133|nr:Fe2+-enterobactin ABC transporter substrate-binding protein [Gephyromycinifex aptenodytis]